MASTLGKGVATGGARFAEVLGGASHAAEAT